MSRNTPSWVLWFMLLVSVIILLILVAAVAAVVIRGCTGTVVEVGKEAEVGKTFYLYFYQPKMGYVYPPFEFSNPWGYRVGADEGGIFEGQVTILTSSYKKCTSGCTCTCSLISGLKVIVKGAIKADSPGRGEIYMELPVYDGSIEVRVEQADDTASAPNPDKVEKVSERRVNFRRYCAPESTWEYISGRFVLFLAFFAFVSLVPIGLAWEGLWRRGSIFEAKRACGRLFWKMMWKVLGG